MKLTKKINKKQMNCKLMRTNNKNRKQLKKAQMSNRMKIPKKKKNSNNLNKKLKKIFYYCQLMIKSIDILNLIINFHLILNLLLLIIKSIHKFKIPGSS